MSDKKSATVPRARALRHNMTKAEIWLWHKLRRPPDPSVKFRRQHPIGPYIADFACVAARLVVEVDGSTHSTGEELAHDARRTAYLKRVGWRVLRVTNDEIYRDSDGVVDAIWRSLKAT